MELNIRYFGNKIRPFRLFKQNKTKQNKLSRELFFFEISSLMSHRWK